MNEVHAHEVLHMMEGNSYPTKSALKKAIAEKFGADQCFYTCSVQGLDIDSLVDFLESKGKFKPAAEGFTMDISKVCKDY